MKKSDIFIALFIGEAVALCFLVILRNVAIEKMDLLCWILPIAFPILSLLGLWIAFLVGKKFHIVFQGAKFALTGALNTFVDLGVLNLLILIFGIASGFGYSAFKAISFGVALINSYFWNKFWTFTPLDSKHLTGFKKKKVSDSQHKKEFFQFFLVSIVGFAINVGTASFIVCAISPQFGLSPEIWANVGAIAAAFTGLTWNFFGYKFIVFK